MYNIRLTIKSIIRAEQLSGKPFNDFDCTSEEDILTLLYCAVLSNNEERMTFEAFKIIVQNEKQYKNVLSEFEKETRILSQFNKKTEDQEIGNQQKTNQYISEIVGALIMSGVDVGYVMNEIELSDLPFLIKAHESRKREEMESGRLWTFYNVLPHVNTRKIKHPSDLITFPWEKEEKEKEGQALIEAYRGEFNKFMNGEYNHLMKH